MNDEGLQSETSVLKFFSLPCTNHQFIKLFLYKNQLYKNTPAGICSDKYQLRMKFRSDKFQYRFFIQEVNFIRIVNLWFTQKLKKVRNKPNAEFRSDKFHTLLAFLCKNNFVRTARLTFLNTWLNLPSSRWLTNKDFIIKRKQVIETLIGTCKS